MDKSSEIYGKLTPQEYIGKCNDLIFALDALKKSVGTSDPELRTKLNKSLCMINESYKAKTDYDLRGHYSYIVGQVKDILASSQDGWDLDIYDKNAEKLKKYNPEAFRKLKTIIQENDEYIEANLRKQENASAISPTDLPAIAPTKNRDVSLC